MLASLVRRSGRVVGRRAALFHTSRTFFAESDSTPGGFKWQHLVTPYSNPEFSSRMRSIEQTLQAMKAELSGVPERVDPINWREWEEKIDDKAMIESIKSSYDNVKVEADKGADVEEFNAQLDKAIAASAQSESVVAEMVSAYKAELTAAKKEKDAVHGWHFHDYLARYPGLAEQMRAEYMEGYQLPPEALERLTDSDLGELRRQVRQGGRLTSEEDLPTKVGDFDYQAELQKTADIAKKLHPSDSAALKDLQAQIDKELLAIKETETTHVEEHH